MVKQKPERPARPCATTALEKDRWGAHTTPPARAIAHGGETPTDSQQERNPPDPIATHRSTTVYDNVPTGVKR